MTSAVIERIAIRGLASAVPSVESPLIDEAARFGQDAIAKVVATTGIHNRRIAPPDMRASDLCQAAGARLLDSLGWDPSSVGLVVFLSQTADYILPSTACTLQDRLGLPKSAAAFDVPLGCSSYSYGLWIASSLLTTLDTSRALVLVGDTLTQNVSREERALWPLFGDAGTATALEKNSDASPMYFDFGTDGSGYKHLILERSGHGDLEPKTLHMNGPAVFSFTLREVPPMINRLLEFSGVNASEINKWVFHQANEFILRNLQKRIKIPDEKFVVDIANWGNTSGATIPLTICNSLKSDLMLEDQRLFLAGFGVGLSWSAAIIDLPTTIVIPEIIEVGQVFSE